ncbi:MAG: hypothetical protein B1H04_04080 [Planctomycetales bacterium 4484_123]|nr:MAG: hypothetical protein B1H04_04080 [Planctomycetales bacterium 4484_123]
MSDEIVYPEQITAEMLKGLYDSAFMDARIDDAGDLRVKDGYWCFVLPPKQGTSIRLQALFAASEAATRQQRLEFANRVNDEITTVRACVNSAGGFTFDYYIPVDGGVTAKSIVLATKFFLRVLAGALRECGAEGIVM